MAGTVTFMARVLVVGKGPPDRGGIAAFLDAMLTSKLADRHELRFLNLARDEVPRSGRFTMANVRRTIADARALWRAAPSADVVHIHTALIPFVTLVRTALLTVIARLRGRPVIVHSHSGKLLTWLTTSFRRRSVGVALRPATRVVAVSQSGRDALADAAGDDRIMLVDNGVDVDRFGPPGGTHQPPRVLYAGVLTPRKGILDLFAASETLRERGVEHELVLIGGHPDEGLDAEAAVRAAAPSDAVFLGPQPHAAMAGHYRDADVFCLPSWWEAMPLSVLEAAASGLPVVATDVGDIARTVIDGETGAVVPARDHDALVNALERFVRDAQLRRAAGDAGRRHVAENFSAARTWEALDALYDALTP
jgi:glycosyltransferase involved in cell wall biosynthesis